MMMAIIAIAKVQLRETHHGRVCFVRLLLMSMMKVTLNIMKRKLRRLMMKGSMLRFNKKACKKYSS